MCRTCLRGIARLAASFPLAGEACAHGLGQRYDLPLPLGLYLFGAAAAVAASFLFLAFFPRARQARTMLGEKPIGSGTIAPFYVMSLQVLSVSALALIVTAGLFGHQSPFKNIGPVAVWVIWWVAMSFVSAFFGNAWAVMNPWSAMFGWANALARKWIKGGLSLGIRYPPRLGMWPAVALFLLFAWTELIASGRDVPRNIAVAILAYSLFTWTGFVLFGRETWLKGGETFDVAFALFGRFAPFRFTEADGRWRWAFYPYAVGLLTREPLPPAQIAFVLVMLGTVTFDGILETPAWAAVLDAAGGEEETEPSTAALLSSFGLCVTPILFAAAYFGIVALMSRMARSAGAQAPSALPMAGLFVLSLVPIAIAYHLAHYLSLLLVAGQFIIPLMSDPFGWGWDLFGTKLYRIDLSVVDARLVWYTAVIAIVTGHIVAVWLSHQIAFQLFGNARQVRLSQYPMMMLMVGYTALSLWILAQPITEVR